MQFLHLLLLPAFVNCNEIVERPDTAILRQGSYWSSTFLTISPVPPAVAKISLEIPEFGSWSASAPQSNCLALMRHPTPQNNSQEFLDSLMSFQQTLLNYSPSRSIEEFYYYRIGDDNSAEKRDCMVGTSVFSTVFSHQLVIPSHRLTSYGRPAFSVTGPMFWNSLPRYLRDPSHTDAVFGRLLKTFLFSEY